MKIGQFDVDEVVNHAYVFIPPALAEAAIKQLEALLASPEPQVRLATANTILDHARLGHINVEPGMLTPFS